MAKTYIDTVKYLIYAEIEIGGLVEKPDVVGAVFGQTEGLLGDELDLRELQKNGRIGRIEVDLNGRGGKTFGMIKVPSSLDMVETSIIAASLEAVDRVGPCEGRLKVQKIEDTRNQKRKVLVERAKNLLKNLLNTEIPESREISEMVRDQVKTAEVTEFGFEKLAAGPGIEKFDELVVVEGRADVINLLKNDISNVIAIGGAKVPKTIIELSKGRGLTVFLDGDRGGDIILNELIQGGVEIDFVARAPVGKEVEELTRKEIIKVLRSKTPFEQIEEYKLKPFAQPYQTPRRYLEQPHSRNERAAQFVRNDRDIQSAAKAIMEKQKEEVNIISSVRSVIEEEKKKPEVEEKPKPKKEEKQEILKPEVPEVKKSKEELIAELSELNNTLKARIYSQQGVLLKEVPVRDVIKTIESTDGVGTIVFDGIITQRLVDIAVGKGVKMIIGIKVGNVSKKPQDLEIHTKNK
ncbi:DNA primase [Candidatus Micrarchaeota archaeon]|nr:DNA primase [Candidatus Micrarchaeota archaeon]